MKSWLNWTTGVILVIGFWIFSWQNIDQVVSLNFDEHHYIPAAKTFLSLEPIINLEHPPLGKMIISWGIARLGDNPQGWRVMSTLFGALTLAGIFLWSMILFRSLATALFVSTLTLFNQMLYVQSRIAMLDTFMAAFLVWAGLCFSYWWRNRKNNSSLILSGLFLGLALATKWFTLFPIAFMGLFVLFNATKTKSTKSVLFFSIPILATYVLCFHPLAQHDNNSWTDFFQWQINMWQQQQSVAGSHPYISSWWSWPLQLRPMWYAYVPNADNTLFQGVALIGNPLLLWSGLVSVIYCGWLSWKNKCSVALEIFIIYCVCLFSWAIIPRKITFFYYYYPAVLILGLALGHALDSLRPVAKKYFEIIRWSFAGIILVCFIYFFPVLSGKPVPTNSFGSWAWLSSWI